MLSIEAGGALVPHCQVRHSGGQSPCGCGLLGSGLAAASCLWHGEGSAAMPVSATPCRRASLRRRARMPWCIFSVFVCGGTKPSRPRASAVCCPARACDKKTEHYSRAGIVAAALGLGRLLPPRVDLGVRARVGWRPDVSSPVPLALLCPA